MEEVFPPYHVFINHRGPDVKRKYASLIYYALVTLGLRVFLDKKELQAGDPFTLAIKSAICSASVQIAIFSKTYAKSAWCLNELLWMLESSHSSKIIPIFCDIQPSDLRDVDKGPYAGAFQDHRNNGRVTIEQVDSWIRALNIVSEIPGVVISTEEDDLGERLKVIEEIVLKYVKRDQVYVCKHPVGLDQEAERLDQSRLRGINTVGIVGDCGSGKTTLVSHVYNSKLSEFERCCFLSVRKKELAYSQQTLLRELLRDPKICIDNTRKGMRMLKDRLKGLSSILIVFDDIDSGDQISNLLFVKDIVGNGSLILVTSRHKTLLASKGIETYDVKPLDAKDAQALVCLHAFGHREPPHELQDMVKELDVGMWPGLPLALVVLGEELRNERDPRKWKQRLESLRQQLPSNVLKQIQIWWRGFWMDCLPTLCQKCPVELGSRDIIRQRAIRAESMNWSMVF